MTKNAIILVICLLSYGISFGQSELYMPVEFKKAYENGTRNWDGSVSSKYWQNRSVYKIKATIDPATRLLSAEAEITYFNNSPDSLKNPVFHTYHDYYKPGSKKAGFFAAANANEDPHEGMVIDYLKIGDEVVDLSDRKKVRYRGTNYQVQLAKAIQPGESRTFNFKWHYVIPGEGFERSGAIDPTSMFVAYWYPEMSVLDDIDGWDRIIYDAATEFYHDYSDYEIEITTPNNFTLWASVEASNPKEVYSDKILDRLAKARTSTEPVSILTEVDFKKEATGKTIWKYKAQNFPDFSFAMSDHFVWDAAFYKDLMGEYFLHSAYPADHTAFKTVIATIQESLKIFHNDFPRYPFPYKHFTIFNGLQGGGMEFPGMANDQEYSGKLFSQWTGREVTDFEANLGLTLHEMCHMYFPFMMGLNEKKYAWMDEGMASFSEYFIPELFESGNQDQPYLAAQRVLPLMVPSYQMEGSGINSYTIGSRSYQALYKLLGKETFLKAMKGYMDTWKYKHPTPYDFFFSMNTASGQNLDWFWKNWYFDWGYMDLGIKSVTNEKIEIENIGGRALPFELIITYLDNSTEKIEFTPVVWKNTDIFTHTLKGNKKTINAVEMVISFGGDADGKNNIWNK